MHLALHRASDWNFSELLQDVFELHVQVETPSTAMEQSLSCVMPGEDPLECCVRERYALRLQIRG